MADEEEQETGARWNWGLGIVFGLIFGTLFGTSLENPGIGLALGVPFAIVFAIAIAFATKPDAGEGPDAARADGDPDDQPR